MMMDDCWLMVDVFSSADLPGSHQPKHQEAANARGLKPCGPATVSRWNLPSRHLQLGIYSCLACISTVYLL